MSTTGESDSLTISGLVMLTFIWSYSWIFMKQATNYIDAFDFTALRCILGALVLLIVFLLRGRGMRSTPFRCTLAIAPLQAYGVADLAQWTLASDGVGKMAILSYTMPFRMVIFTVLLLGERLRRGQYFATLIAAFGLFLVLQPWQLDFSPTKSAMLTIFSGVSWGVSTIAAKRLYARRPHMDLLSLTPWRMLYAALVTSIVTLLVSQRGIDRQPIVSWTLAYGAILATALAWSSWLFVLKSLPVSTASLGTLTVPVYNIFFSWWLLGGNPGVVEGSGIVLVVLALALVNRRKKEAISVKRI